MHGEKYDDKMPYAHYHFVDNELSCESVLYTGLIKMAFSGFDIWSGFTKNGH